MHPTVSQTINHVLSSSDIPSAHQIPTGSDRRYTFQFFLKAAQEGYRLYSQFHNANIPFPIDQPTKPTPSPLALHYAYGFGAYNFWCRQNQAWKNFADFVVKTRRAQHEIDSKGAQTEEERTSMPREHIYTSRQTATQNIAG